MRVAAAVTIVILAIAGSANAGQVTVTMHAINASGVGDSVGTITAQDGKYGLALIPDLKQLSPGKHGFHVHQNPDCGPAEKAGKMAPGVAAGGHYDPAGTGRHEGPAGNGHLGDLPGLLVNGDGTATLPVVAPRLKVADLKGRALMIHAGGDNYSDQPKKLGGGGARVACGVIGQ